MRLRVALIAVFVVSCSRSNTPGAEPASTASAAAKEPAAQTEPLPTQRAAHEFASKPPEALRAWARAELQRLLPEWTIENGAESLSLQLRHDEQRLEAWLGRPFEYCATGNPDCERNARDYLAGVAEAAVASAKTKAADPEQLIPAVRSRAVLESYQARAAGVLFDPIAGDLVVIYMVDSPRMAGPVSDKTCAELNLTPEELKKRALQNLGARLPAPSKAVRLQSGQTVGMIEVKDYYTSSLLVPHSAWADVAKAFGGKLLVAVPAPETLLYARESDPSALRAITDMAFVAFRRSPRGTSRTVLRWTSSSWEVAESSPH